MILASPVTTLACRMKLIHCPCGAPKEVFTSRSDPDDDFSVTILACRVTILTCRMELIHCPCGAPKEVFTSRSDPDDDLSVMILACRVMILACRMKQIHCPCGGGGVIIMDSQTVPRLITKNNVIPFVSLHHSTLAAR
ncbi:hypothetical protein MTP99_015729 [Tenebrio molitor]|nr:hypothetical protein MTP99_015729 [Tenebrio molitor]